MNTPAKQSKTAAAATPAPAAPTPAPAAAAPATPVASATPVTPAKPKVPVVPQKGWRNFNGQDNSKFKPKHFQAPRFIQARRAPGK